MAKSWTDSTSRSRSYSTPGSTSWDSWQSHSDFIRRDFLKHSLHVLESALHSCGDTKSSKGELEWYKQQVDTIFRKFSREDR
jgi:hypothetical protein